MIAGQKLAGRAAGMMVGGVMVGMLAIAASAAAQAPAPATGAATAPAAATPAAGITTLKIGYLAVAEPARTPLSFLETVAEDEGVMGARLGIRDNNSTGRFLKQNFELVEVIVPSDQTVAAALDEMHKSDIRLVIADLPADRLREALAAPVAAEMTFLNSRAPDDVLRQEECRANLWHVTPSRRMLADALAQYLLSKRWMNWALVIGPGEGDRAYADAIRDAATRFRARIVAEKEWTLASGNRRADSGHVTAQAEIPALTQVADHDVLIVADEQDGFGDELLYRTWLPRPVAGTHGLVPTAWSRTNENWGGTQLQSRFERLAKRWMTSRDYTAWLALRAVGEAATRGGGATVDKILPYMRGPDLAVPAFKGQALSFRQWDNQMRQPILLAGPRLLVSVSPQEGFLHQTSTLDTLGTDRPESRCRL